MPWSDTREQHRVRRCDDAVLDLIVSHRYLAPAYLAVDDARQRALADVAQRQRLGKTRRLDMRSACLVWWQALRAWIIRIEQGIRHAVRLPSVPTLEQSR